MKPPIEPYRSINGMNNLLMALLDLCYYSIMLQCSRIDVKAPDHFFLKIEPMLHLFRRQTSGTIPSNLKKMWKQRPTA